MRLKNIFGIVLLIAVAVALAFLRMHSPSLEATVRAAVSSNQPIASCTWLEPWNDRRFRLVGWSSSAGGGLWSNDAQPILAFRLPQVATSNWRVDVRYGASSADVQAGVDDTKPQRLSTEGGIVSTNVSASKDDIVLIRFRIRHPPLHFPEARYLGVFLLGARACPQNGS